VPGPEPEDDPGIHARGRGLHEDGRVKPTAARLNLSFTIGLYGVLLDGPCDPGSPCASAPSSGRDCHGRMDPPKEELTAKGLTSG
jgi:hypothetical protein